MFRHHRRVARDSAAETKSAEKKSDPFLIAAKYFDPNTITSVINIPDTKYFATVDQHDNKIQFWSFDEKENEIKPHHHFKVSANPHSLCINSKNQLICGTGLRNQMIFEYWDISSGIENGTCVEKRKISNLHHSIPNLLIALPDDSLVYSLQTSSAIFFLPKNEKNSRILYLNDDFNYYDIHDLITLHNNKLLIICNKGLFFVDYQELNKSDGELKLILLTSFTPLSKLIDIAK